MGHAQDAPRTAVSRQRSKDVGASERDNCNPSTSHCTTALIMRFSVSMRKRKENTFMFSNRTTSQIWPSKIESVCAKIVQFQLQIVIR